jgi:hypothetical protein
MDSSNGRAATMCSYTFRRSRTTEGSEVEFEVKQGPKGLQAENVARV